MAHRILIVEDQADIRKLIRMTLEFEDYDVREAAYGDAALALAEEFQPDLVLLDVMMPGAVNGLEVCRRLRAERALGTGPRVIMLSARGQASDREAGLQAGADTYLVKPFSPLQLISCIGELWAAA